MHDIAVIGGGPAGLSAAITARARNKDVLVISNPLTENPLAAAKLVENYPGMPSASGLTLLKAMHEQALELGAQFLQARVISVLPFANAQKTTFAVTTSSSYLEAQSLIIACGAASGGKPYAGEVEYLGRGVSYCATCDGMLYRASTVLVAGHSAEAAKEANFLAELGATVHFVAQKLPKNLDTRIMQHKGRLLAIEGNEQSVTHVRLKNATGEELKLPLQGVFLLRPSIAHTSMMATLQTENGAIKTDPLGRTNLPGVFAAGDCTGKPLQIAKAVGEGLVAVLNAVEYLSD